MPYHLYVENRKGKGSQWRIVFEFWENGLRKRRQVPEKEWANLGITKELTPEKVKAKLVPLNDQEKLTKEHTQVNKARTRVSLLKLTESAYLPPDIVQAFEIAVVKVKPIRQAHWLAAQEAIIKAPTLPIGDWGESPYEFYAFFQSKQWSLDYVSSIVGVINAWGRFLCKRTKQFWQDIPRPTGDQRKKIKRANRTAKTRKKPNPLTLELLKSKEKELDPAMFRWLYVAIAFGLRPEEVDPKLWKRSTAEGCEWLSVWQLKLDRMEENEETTWKHIPILEERQEVALTFLDQELKYPKFGKAGRGLKKVFGENITPYSCRHEFYNYTIAKYGEYWAQRWMGHKYIQTGNAYADKTDRRYVKALLKRAD